MKRSNSASISCRLYTRAGVLAGDIHRLAGALIARGQREEGQTMAEYALLVLVIALVVIAAATLLGKSVSSVFSSVAGKF